MDLLCHSNPTDSCSDSFVGFVHEKGQEEVSLAAVN